jgi:hypothetical protein
MYIVSCSKAHDTPRILGRFETFEQALNCVHQAGAIGDGQQSGEDRIYDVDGHEGDDNYGIWIEKNR